MSQDEAIRDVGLAFGSDTPTGLTPQQEAAFTRVREAFSINTEDAEDAVREAQDTEGRLRGTPTAPEEETEAEPTPTEEATPKEGRPEPSQTSVTLINPDTGQSVSFNDADLNRDQIKGFISSGFQLSEAEGQVPPWLTATGVDEEMSTDEVDEQEENVAAARKEVDNAIKKTRNFNVENDPALNQILTNIENTWNSRIEEMEEVNRRRQRSLQTLGLRIGAQFTGGVRGGVFGGVISEEERQSSARIADLEGKKQSALAEARIAYEKKQWDRYVDQINIAQQDYENQIAELERLQEAQAEQTEKITKEERRARIDTTVAGLVEEGVTDPSAILDLLNRNAEGNIVGDATLDEVDKALSVLMPDNEDVLASATADYRTFKLMQESGEVPENWSYLDYQAALSNAKRKQEQPEDDFIELSTRDKTALLGAGFTATDIENIARDVNTHGIEAVLEGVEDEEQKKELRDVYGVQSKVTRDQIEQQVDFSLRKGEVSVEDVLRNNLSQEELRQKAYDAGFTKGGGVGASGEAGVTEYLASSEARTEAKSLYTDLLTEQYQSTGMLQE